MVLITPSIKNKTKNNQTQNDLSRYAHKSKKSPFQNKKIVFKE